MNAYPVIAVKLVDFDQKNPGTLQKSAGQSFSSLLSFH